MISLYQFAQEDEQEFVLSHGKTHVTRESGLSPFILGFIFIIVTMANIIAKKDQMKFYLILLIMIIVPIIVLSSIN